LIKYRNKKTNGFDSAKEARRFAELKIMQKAGEISLLECQVRFQLIPPQDGERGLSYVADFRYTTKAGAVIVEDVKGFKTDVYLIKRKLMLHIHGIKIVEI
jgi:hypothetical protein